MLIAAGAAIYAWRCPGEAKKYDTAVEYALSEAEFFTANPIIMEIALKRAIANLRISRPEIFFDHLTIWAKIDTARSHPNRARRKDAVMVLMDELWHAQNHNHLFFRRFCRVVYDVGLGLIFFPSLWTLVQVVQLVL